MAAGRFAAPGLLLAAVPLAILIGYASAANPVLTLAAVGAAIVAALVVLETRFVLLILVAVLPWEGALNFPSETVSAVKILGALLFAGYAFRLAQREERIHTSVTTYAVAVFVLLVGLSLIASPDPAAGVGKFLRYLLFAAFFFLVVQLVDGREWLLRLLRTLALSLGMAALWALVPFLAGELERAGGPITDPNDFGYLMTAGLPLVAYLAVVDRRWRPVWALSFVLVLAASAATLSRGVAVALLVLVIWAVATRRLNIGGLLASTATLLLVLGTAVLFFAPLIDERLEQKGRVAGANVASREALWEGAIRMTMDRPVLGVGPERYGVESTRYVREDPVALRSPVTHNTYLEVLAENGILALGAFLVFLGGSWLGLSRVHRDSLRSGRRESARLATAMQASLLVAIVGAFFLSEQLATPFWLLGALAVVIPRLIDEGEFEPQPSP